MVFQPPAHKQEKSAFLGCGISAKASNLAQLSWMRNDCLEFDLTLTNQVSAICIPLGVFRKQTS